MFDYAKISCRERQLKITSVDWTKPYKTAVPFIHLCDKSNDLSIHVQRVVQGREDGCEGFCWCVILSQTWLSKRNVFPSFSPTVYNFAAAVSRVPVVMGE